MDLNKRILTAGALSVLVTLGMTAYSGVANAQPKLNIHEEEASHPRIMSAVREMRGALKELREAPHDFGGNKAAAMQDTERAIHSLRKAMYYRLHMDDAAIDRAQ